MPTENTSLKNTTPVGDSNTSNEMVIGKINTYQRTFLILAGSLLALLVLIAVAGTSGVQHLQSSAHEITEGAVTLADYQVDSANLALYKDIFGLDADGGFFCNCWLCHPGPIIVNPKTGDQECWCCGDDDDWAPTCDHRCDKDIGIREDLKPGISFSF